MWAAVSVSGLIGAYLFHKQQRRIQYNSESVHVPGLYSLVYLSIEVAKQISRAILMQDGATPPHSSVNEDISKIVIQLDRIIGKHFTKEWPAESPDLTPADYYLWPQLKSRMYQGQQPFKSIRSLKRTITHHTNKLRDVNRGHLVDSVLKRWRWCINVKGERLHKSVNGQAL